MASEFDVEIDVAIPEKPKINRKSQAVFVFRQPRTDDCDGRTLKLGRTFCFLELDLRQETMGILYYDWIAKIIEKLKTYQIFSLTRVGLRKYNNFFILDCDKARLDDIFKIDYLSNITCDDFELDNFANMQEYIYGDYRLRFTKSYSSGILSNQTMKIDNELGHQISFDFDMYTEADRALDKFTEDASKHLEDINANIRTFFNRCINDEIIEKLDAGEDLKEYGVIAF